MTFKRASWAALAATVVLAACGGGDDNGSGFDFKRLVAFGDSLSDVGTYNVGTVAMVGAQTGGAGRWTVNDTKGGQVWIEQLSGRLDVPAACAAETGLLPNNPAITGAPVTAHAGCTNYAQGSSRVVSVLGPNSVGMQKFKEVNIGLLAKPVKDQMAAHLAAAGGGYRSDDLVVVMAGANDIFMELALMAPVSASQAVQNVGTAGAELGKLIRSEVVDKGARHVLVLNVPNLSKTPGIQAKGANAVALADTMTRTFNDQLAQSLQGVSQVRLADAYGLVNDMVANPRKYDLSNVTDVACGPNALSTAPTVNGSSLVCNKSNLLSGDRSRYLFADDVHPTPFAHRLFSDFAVEQMRDAGWD